ncbi:phage portal protein [Pluralibacter gergoviae]|nr:phage portal protein [Pluralibacter gergoviae]
MFGFRKKKVVEEIQQATIKHEIRKVDPLTTLKNSQGKRALSDAFNKGTMSPVISFGFSGGNQAGNINAIINKTLPVSVAVSRELALKNGVVKKYVSTSTAGVCGPEGLYVRPNVHLDSDERNNDVNRILEKAFYKWAEDPKAFSLNGQLDFSTFTRLVERTRSIDGDCFVRIHTGKDGLPKVEVLDSMRMGVYNNQFFDNTYISNGIEYEFGTNKVVAYWVTHYNPVLYQYDLGNRERVPAEDMLHLFAVDFPDQQRGIPDVHAGTEQLKELESFMGSSIAAKRLACQAMAFITSPDVDHMDLLSSDEIPFYDDLNMRGGAIAQLQPGQDIKTINPNAATDTISEFVDSQLMMIAMSLDMVPQSLKSDTARASFSASKLADKLQQSTYATKTNSLIVNILKPLYIRWLKAAMLNNTLDLNFSDFDKLTEALFVKTTEISLDPLKDAQVQIRYLQNGLKSREMIISEMGYDPAIVMEQIAKDKNNNSKEEIINGNGNKPEEGDQSQTN